MSSHAKDHHRIVHHPCSCPKNVHVHPAAPQDLDHQLVKVWNSLNEVKCRLTRHSTDGVKDLSKIYPEQEILNQTENEFKHDGVWGGDIHKHVPKGQAQMNELMDEIHELIEKIQGQSNEKESEAIKEARETKAHGNVHV